LKQGRVLSPDYHLVSHVRCWAMTVLAPRSSRSVMMALLSDCDKCCARAQLLAFSLFDGSSNSM
jgi:hypothetical protein